MAFAPVFMNRRTKMRSSSWIWIIITGISLCIAGNYRQERAEIKYFNPKYVRDAQAFTGRQRRGDPYKTNLTATIIMPWANNVTAEISYKTKSSPTPLTISLRFCDVIKTKWMADFLRTYSTIKLSCPLQPGTYSIMNIELPPKNFPLPIPKGEVRVKMTHYVTDTKEMIMLTTMVMHSE